MNEVVIFAVMMDANYVNICVYKIKCTVKFSNLEHYLIFLFFLCFSRFQSSIDWKRSSNSQVRKTLCFILIFPPYALFLSSRLMTGQLVFFKTLPLITGGGQEVEKDYVNERNVLILSSSSTSKEMQMAP